MASTPCLCPDCEYLIPAVSGPDGHYDDCGIGDNGYPVGCPRLKFLGDEGLRHDDYDCDSHSCDDDIPF